MSFKDVIFQFEYAKSLNIIPQTLAYDIHESVESAIPSKNKLEIDEDETKSSKKVKTDDELATNKEENTAKPMTSKQAAQVEDNMEDLMTCSICIDIMHDCISLQPCLHTYCAGCCSEWMAKSKECPICKKEVERISKNHIVNNIIESYLKNNSEKRRSLDELKKLDEKNKITHDMVRI